MDITYKNYVLKSSSYQLAETKKWRAKIAIFNSPDTNGAIPIQPITLTDYTYNTKEEADAHAINYGKEIVDGKHPKVKLPL